MIKQLDDILKTHSKEEIIELYSNKDYLQLKPKDQVTHVFPFNNDNFYEILDIYRSHVFGNAFLTYIKNTDTNEITIASLMFLEKVK